MKINVEHELMKNYVYAEPHQISNKMQACQAADGHALLFTISDDGYFQVWQEKHGNSVGWWALNLTSGGMGNCIDFNVSQNFQTGYIDIVIIMSLNAQISLYVSLQNPINPMIDVAWSTLSSYWENLNFGIPNTDMRNAYITYENSFSNGKYNLANRYLVIDTAKATDLGFEVIKRYYIQLLGLGVSNNPHQPPPGPEVWQVQNDGFFKTTSKSALGRRSLTENYGIYTLQPFGNNFNSLYFTQVYDRNNTSIPQTPQQILTLGSPTSFALASKPDGSTFLFIACDNDSDGRGGKSISVFAPGMQSLDNTQHILITHDMIFEVTQLFADSTDTETILWGLNGLTQIFRVKCPKGQELNPAAWSVPVPIIQGATNITAYLNRVTGHSTIFAQTIDRGLIKLKQDPATKIWQQRNILKPTLAVKQVHEIDAFTTHIQCMDDNNLPLHSFNPISLKIKTDSQASFYVNNQYTVISPGDEPAFQVDETGVLTIVQETHSLSAVQFTISDPMSGTSVKVNPMGKIMDKISGISSWNDLNIPVFDEQGIASNLISGNPSETDKAEFLQVFPNLKGAWTKIKSGNNAVRTNAPATWGLSFNATGWDYHEGAATVNLMNSKLRANTAAVIDSTNAIDVIAEDLFKWMKTAYDNVAHYVFEEITEGFRFLLTVGEKVYKIIIKEVNSLIQAVELLFNKVKIKFVQLKSWLGFVLDWGDIKRTHNVFKNIYDIYAKHAIDGVTALEAKINTEFNNAIAYINSWKTLSALPSLPDNTFNLSANSISNQMAGNMKVLHTPQSNLLVHHYKHNFLNMSGVNSDLVVPANILDDILRSFENQIDNFIMIKDQIQTRIIDNFHSLTLKDIIQQLYEILKTSVLSTITNVLGTIQRIIIDVINGVVKPYLTQAVQKLEDPIDIPVISWLYKQIVGEELSYRGMVCFICAFPATIGYKTIAKKNPFPANDPTTNALLNATDYQGLLTIYSGRAVNRVTRDDNDSPSVADFFSALFGICALGTAPLITWNNVRGYWVELKGGIPIGDGIAKSVAKFNAFANIAYVSPNVPSVVPFNAVNIMNDVFTSISVIKGFLPVIFNKKLTTPTATKVLDWMEFGLNLAWNVPVIVNICTNKDNPNYRGLTSESIGDFAFNLGGMLTPFVPIAVKKGSMAGGTVLATQGIMVNGYGLFATISGLVKAKVF
jgi:hypothetical protein